MRAVMGLRAWLVTVSIAIVTRISPACPLDWAQIGRRRLAQLHRLQLLRRPSRLAGAACTSSWQGSTWAAPPPGASSSPRQRLPAALAVAGCPGRVAASRVSRSEL